MPYQRVDRLPGIRFESAGEDAAELSTTAHRIELKMGTRQARCNDMNIWLHEAPRRIRGNVFAAQVDVDAVLLPMLQPDLSLRTSTTGIIMLDPGHGGRDDGARGGRSTREKELALDVCTRVRNLLRAHGMDVRLTREKDVYIDLEERARLAQSWQSDVFVSVHFNKAGNRSATGVETFVLTAPGYRSTSDPGDDNADSRVYPGQKSSVASAVLGQRVHGKLLKTTEAADRGIRRARFVVLRQTVCPAVLVECGFLSNREEEAKIITPAYRQKISEGIALGILDYLRAVNLARVGAE